MDFASSCSWVRTQILFEEPVRCVISKKTWPDSQEASHVDKADVAYRNKGLEEAAASHLNFFKREHHLTLRCNRREKLVEVVRQLRSAQSGER